MNAAREGQTKRQKQKKKKVRAVDKIGGRKRAVPGRERAANEKRQRGSKRATNRRKQKVKHRSLGINIDLLRLFTTHALDDLTL